MKKLLIGILFGFILFFGCVEETPEMQLPDMEPPDQLEPEQPEYYIVPREEAIPDDAVKITPEMDLNPPILYSDEYEEPMPMPYPINTAGAEDSGFMMPDGNTFYVWFTPDPNAPLGE